MDTKGDKQTERCTWDWLVRQTHLLTADTTIVPVRDMIGRSATHQPAHMFQYRTFCWPQMTVAWLWNYLYLYMYLCTLQLITYVYKLICTFNIFMSSLVWTSFLSETPIMNSRHSSLLWWYKHLLCGSCWNYSQQSLNGTENMLCFYV